MSRGNGGFSLVEVLVAIVVLSVGLIALVGSMGMATRMVARGKVETRVAQAAAQRMDALRLTAYSTSPKCTAGGFASGGPVTADGLTTSWIVPAVGKVRTVRVTVTYPTARGPRTADLETRIEC